MGTKRDIDSGRKDALGRTVKISGDQAAARSDAPPPPAYHDLPSDYYDSSVHLDGSTQYLSDDAPRWLKVVHDKAGGNVSTVFANKVHAGVIAYEQGLLDDDDSLNEQAAKMVDTDPDELQDWLENGGHEAVENMLRTAGALAPDDDVQFLLWKAQQVEVGEIIHQVNEAVTEMGESDPGRHFIERERIDGSKYYPFTHDAPAEFKDAITKIGGDHNGEWESNTAARVSRAISRGTIDPTDPDAPFENADEFTDWATRDLTRWATPERWEAVDNQIKGDTFDSWSDALQKSQREWNVGMLRSIRDGMDRHRR